MVTGRFGFHSSNGNDNDYRLIEIKHYAQYFQRPLFNNLNLSEEFKNLFVKMVAFAQNERPTIEEILNNVWMQEINNLNNEQMNALENEVRNEFQIREN